jgi:hypothetical protein
MRIWALLFFLTGCGGLAWNTTLADHPKVRAAMLSSVVPGKTTESRFRTQWGHPTQRIREGAETAYVYRNMSNPPGYPFPQFGDSNNFVVVLFQYGVAVGAYSSDEQGCRATFAPRPPGAHYPNPTTVKPVNCGELGDAGADRTIGAPAEQGGLPLVPEDTYLPSAAGK